MPLNLYIEFLIDIIFVTKNVLFLKKIKIKIWITRNTEQNYKMYQNQRHYILTLPWNSGIDVDLTSAIIWTSLTMPSYVVN